MKTLFPLILVMIMAIGCQKPTVVRGDAEPIGNELKIGMMVIGSDGYKYRLVRPEKQLGDGFSDEELWERIDPLVTNRWYSRTLPSRLDTSQPPSFNSLMRFPSEQF